MMFTICLISKPVVNAEASQPKEYQIKAAFLYNFANFVEWPEGSFSDETSPIVLGILGEDPFGVILESVEGKAIAERHVTIKRFKKLEDVGFCHILYICPSENKKIRNILAKLNRFGVLTIGDMDGFAQSGGIINFIKVDNKIRFEINLDVAKACDLEISSKLLSMARIVKSSKTEADN